VARLQGQEATANWDTAQARRSRWFQLCWLVIGLGLDWRCAFEWFGGKSSFYSAVVLGRAGLIVLACAGVAILAVCAAREARWRHALPLFFVASLVVYNILSVYWIAHRR
jgi:hypothetical protein